MISDSIPFQTEGTCTRCGAEGSVTCVREGLFLCRDCLNSGYALCPTCRQYVKKEDLKEYDPGYCGADILLCAECAKEYGY